MVGVHFEQAGFCGRGAAGPPQQTNLRSTSSRSTGCGRYQKLGRDTHKFPPVVVDLR
jgi:hypothetical protein